MPGKRKPPDLGGCCHSLSGNAGRTVVIIREGENHAENDFMYRGGETAQTLDASYYKGPGARNGKEREIVATEPIYLSDRKGHNAVSTDGTATTLTAQEKERPIMSDTIASVVRRLTPLECERLQGFPDNWSKYGLYEDGKVKELSDSARYRLQGNSIARPFWSWLTRRIAAQYETVPTLGGLFSGQGGFELCWEEVNGIGTAKWSSEIEKEAVSVIRMHFGDDELGVEGDVRQFL